MYQRPPLIHSQRFGGLEQFVNRVAGVEAVSQGSIQDIADAGEMEFRTERGRRITPWTP